MIANTTIVTRGLLLFLFCLASAIAQDPIDLQQLNEMKSKWQAMANAKQRISLQGRFAARAGNLVRLQKSKMVFRVREGVVIPRIKNGNNIELIGYLQPGDGELEFVVLRLAEGSTDVDQLERRRNRLPKDKHQPWYELAAWANRRAAFYADSDLLRDSRALIDAGFEIERRSIKRGDFKSLRSLADRAEGMQIDRALQAELIHQALWWEWQSLSKKKPLKNADRQKFLDKLKKELKGVVTPVRIKNTKLKRSYQQQPERTYAEAGLSNRLLLHRFFYRRVLLPMIVATALEDGSNGAEVAKAIRKEIPEEFDLAADYDIAAVQFRVKISDTLTRSEMLELVDQLERTNQRKLAKSTKLKWVRESAKRLARRGPAGLVQAANEYDALLGDKKKAIALLKQAWDQSSEKAEIEERLERYDLYRRDDAWMSKAQVDSLPRNQMQQAMREGRVIKGMTKAQVRKSLGQPDRISRFVTRGETQIAWSFLDTSSNRIVVLFNRRATSRGQTQTLVTSVSTMPRK